MVLSNLKFQAVIFTPYFQRPQESRPTLAKQIQLKQKSIQRVLQQRFLPAGVANPFPPQTPISPQPSPPRQGERRPRPSTSIVELIPPSRAIKDQMSQNLLLQQIGLASRVHESTFPSPSHQHQGFHPASVGLRTPAQPAAQPQATVAPLLLRPLSPAVSLTQAHLVPPSLPEPVIFLPTSSHVISVGNASSSSTSAGTSLSPPPVPALLPHLAPSPPGNQLPSLEVSALVPPFPQQSPSSPSPAPARPPADQAPSLAVSSPVPPSPQRSPSLPAPVPPPADRPSPSLAVSTFVPPFPHQAPFSPSPAPAFVPPPAPAFVPTPAPAFVPTPAQAPSSLPASAAVEPPARQFPSAPAPALPSVFVPSASLKSLKHFAAVGDANKPAALATTTAFPPMLPHLPKASPSKTFPSNTSATTATATRTFKPKTRSRGRSKTRTRTTTTTTVPPTLPFILQQVGNPNEPEGVSLSSEAIAPEPPMTHHFANTNAIDKSGDGSGESGPPGFLPPSDAVIDELNNADDFMAVAKRLQLKQLILGRHKRRAHSAIAEQSRHGESRHLFSMPDA